MYRRAAKYDGGPNVIGEKLVHRCEARHGHNESGKMNEPVVQHLAQTQTARYVARDDGTHDDGGDFQTATFNSHTRCTTNDTADPGSDSKAEGSLPQGRGKTGGEEAAWPPSPPSFPNSPGTEELCSPHRQHGASQERRGRARASSLDYRSLTFVQRQELEQLAAEHRHEELVRAEDEARRKLASGGRWINRTSRAILTRSSYSFRGGDGGRSASSPPGTRGRHQGPSVFERLARRSLDHDSTSKEEWMRERSIGGNGDGGHGRQPFTPVINPRSSLLAARDRDEDGGPQQRLYHEGKEQLRRRERRAQLADRARRERSVSCHVNPESERVLARRNRSRVVRFQSNLMEVLEVKL